MNETERAKSSGMGGRVGAALVVVWLLLVNIFYYLQFRELFLARLGNWIHRWR